MRIIYADEMFMLNLVIDYFIVLATAKLCALPLKRLRFGLAALFGALYAVLPLWPPLYFLSHPILKVLCGAAMVFLAFGKRPRFLRIYIAFFAVSAALGGAVYAATLLSGTPPSSGAFQPISMRVLLLSFAVTYCALTLVLKRTGSRLRRQTVEVVASLGDNTVRFTALMDTGNELYDPAGGLPVMVADLNIAESLLPKAAADALKVGACEFMSTVSLDASLCARFRLVPFSTVNGRALMPVFTPDRLTVNGNPKDDLLLGLTAGELCGDREFSAIL